ncbi:predicted protein [Lichtheimia corymbifera JMRC:FSU:9682]|uniref:Uncharacterized protein n=1 Tax=Lichtheimia corymbifera JMRC:FSU:9682 TaxID=1263082 RepID=A0A068RXP6_9FUNG|nr:predicted protein [Lichtheimia corymbifera JMRC:FSU:9682]
MAVLEYISWSELLENTNLTAEHADSPPIRPSPYDRARLFANSAQFDKALRDAAAIRTLLPGSGLGYLCMGDVYCQQGHYAAAISIYDHGLEAVPDSDPYYQHLQQCRSVAVTSNNKRVDFISQLPLDIVVTNILPRMEPACLASNELYGPLYVSRTWQKRIVQQSKGLTLGFDQETDTFKTGHDLLVRFAPDLYLYCDSTTPHLPTLHGLQLISDSLTHLHIDGYHAFELCDILESCPNLVSLETGSVEAVISSPPSSHYPNLTHLALHDVSEEAPSHDDVIDILSLFPSLLSFELTPTADSSILTMLHEYCPYLQVLYYGAKNYHPKKIDAHPNRKGIRSAHLGGEYIEDLFIQGDLVQFLYIHRNVLETVEFGGEFEADDSLWKLNDRNSEASFMGLTSIDLATTRPFLSLDIITWLISNAPNVKNIGLNELYLQPHVANAMINSIHLPS